MAYTPTVWATGDVVTAEKLNKLENTIVGNVKDVSGTYEYTDNDNQSLTETFDNAVIENNLEGNVANAPYAHAEGDCTTAIGYASHAEGGSTYSSGDGSHTEGIGTIASGMASHAEGYQTRARGTNQHVFGKFNEEDNLNTYCEIVGIGNNENSRKNGRTLDWNGNEKLTGSLTLGAGTANEIELTPETLRILLNMIPTEENQ